MHSNMVLELMMDSIYFHFHFTFLFSFHFISYFELRVGVSMTSYITVTICHTYVTSHSHKLHSYDHVP